MFLILLKLQHIGYKFVVSGRIATNTTLSGKLRIGHIATRVLTTEFMCMLDAVHMVSQPGQKGPGKIQYCCIQNARRWGGLLVAHQSRGRGPGFESGISHNDPGSLQDHSVVCKTVLKNSGYVDGQTLHLKHTKTTTNEKMN